MRRLDACGRMCCRWVLSFWLLLLRDACTLYVRVHSSSSWRQGFAAVAGSDWGAGKTELLTAARGEAELGTLSLRRSPYGVPGSELSAFSRISRSDGLHERAAERWKVTVTVRVSRQGSTKPAHARRVVLAVCRGVVLERC